MGEKLSALAIEVARSHFENQTPTPADLALLAEAGKGD
jgi:hypothetical protein